MGYTVRQHREASELESLIPEWEQLAAAALEPNPFFEHWLFLPTLRAFGSRDDARVLCVSHRGKLCGLFPVRRLRRFKGIPVATLATWRNPHGLLGTPLVAREHGAACLAALFEWLEEKRFASLLDFQYVPAGGAFHQALTDVVNVRGRVARVAEIYSRGLLCRARDAESYIASALSSDSRQKLRRAEKRLQEQGKVVHRVLGPGDDVQAWIDEFLRVEASGWKGERGSALQCSDANRRFAREVFTAAHRRGQLVMVGMDVDGRPVARYSGFIAGEGAFAFKTAYDETFRRFSPGLLAELDMIRAVHELPGVRWMDSVTRPWNGIIDRMWKDRMLVQRIMVGVNPWGEFVGLALLPLLQCVKRWSLRAAARRTKSEAEDGAPKPALAVAR
jgi:CelD/BcsL family acetyltransferase involved in cellulose biosynthesis